MNATTLEAYAQSKGMEGFAYATASNAEKTALAMQMFMEQTTQYAGNFKRESAETLSGSLGAVKSAWQDLLGNIALGNSVDLTPMTTTITNAANNLIPAIGNVIVQLPNMMVTLVSGLAPTLATQGMNLLINLINGFAAGLPTALPMITQTLLDIIQAIIAELPQFLQSGSTLISGLVEGIMASIDLIISVAPDIILALVTALSDNIPMIIDQGVVLLISLINDLPRIIQGITAALPALVTGICRGIIDNIALIIEAGIQLFVALLEALPEILRQLGPLIGELITGIFEALKSFFTNFVEIGEDLILGLRDGIKNAASKIWEAVKDMCRGVVDKVKNFFTIGSPSKLFAEYGGFLMEGFAIGIDDNASLVTKSIDSVSEDVANSMRYDLGSSASLAMSGIESGNASFVENLSAAIGDQRIAVYLDGKQLSDSVTKHQRMTARAMA